MEKQTILLVDDEVELLKAMEIRLSSWGYNVIAANNGKDAINIVKEKALDAIILDIMMPEMDGLQTLRQIRKFNKNIPVLMLTAFGSEKRIEDSDKLGISGFVHKGAEFVNASEAIHVVLRGMKSE